MSDILFFDIKNPDIQARIVLQNELAFAFLTNIPIVDGHTLIAPIRNIQTVQELTPDELQSMLSLLWKVRSTLTLAVGAQGFNYAWNEGAVAGQSVPHLHIHILPRKEKDSGVHEYDPRKFLYRPGSRPISSNEELESMAVKIRKYVRSC